MDKICPCFVLTSIQLNICSDRVAGDLIAFGYRLKKKASVLSSALTALCFNRPIIPRHKAEWLDGTYFQERWSLFGAYFSKIRSSFGP